MKWERYVGPAAAAVAASAASAARMPVAAVAALLLGACWFLADRRGRYGTAGLCFVVVCLVAILPLMSDGAARVLAGIAIAGAICGYAASGARAMTRGSSGAVDETVRARAREAASVVFPAAAVALLVAAGRAAIGFWSLLLIALLALVGLSALIRRIR